LKPFGRYAQLKAIGKRDEADKAIQAGVRYVFANLGSDHPAILEAMVKGQKERKDQWVKVITCPNEVLVGQADAFKDSGLRV